MPRYLVIAIVLAAICVLPLAAQSPQSDSLFNQGVELYNAGQYAESIPLFAVADSLDCAELDSTSGRRGYAREWMASAYYRLGNETRARQLDTIMYMLLPVDRRLTVRSDSVFALAQQAESLNQAFLALRYYKEGLALEVEALGEGHYFTANTHATIANSCCQTGDVEQALGYFQTAYDLLTRWMPHFTTGMFYSQLNLADAYFNIGNNEQAMQWLDSLDIYTLSHFGKMSFEYGEVLSRRIMYAANMGQWNIVKREYERTLQIAEQHYGPYSENVVGFMRQMAQIYQAAGKTREAQTISHDVTGRAKHMESDVAEAERLGAEMQTAVSYFGRGEYSRAAAIYKRILQQTKDAPRGNLRDMHWMMVALNEMCLLGQRKLDKFTLDYDMYCRAKNETVDPSVAAMVGYVYLWGACIARDLGVSDTTLMVLDQEASVLKQTGTAKTDIQVALGTSLLYFLHGKFAQGRMFSSIGLDHAYELMNKPDQAFMYPDLLRSVGQTVTALESISRDLRNGYDTFMSKTDSSTYAINKMLADLYECRMTLRLVMDDQQAAEDYYQYYNTVFFYCEDTIRGREFTEDFINKVVARYGKENRMYIRIMLWYLQTFPKGDADCRRRYEELIAIEERTHSFYLDFIRSSYLSYIGQRVETSKPSLSELAQKINPKKKEYLFGTIHDFVNAAVPAGHTSYCLQVVDDAIAGLGKKDGALLADILLVLTQSNKSDTISAAARDSIIAFIDRHVEQHPQLRDDRVMQAHLRYFESTLYPDVADRRACIQRAIDIVEPGSDAYAEYVHALARFDVEHDTKNANRELILRQTIKQLQQYPSLFETEEYKSLHVALFDAVYYQNFYDRHPRAEDLCSIGRQILDMPPGARRVSKLLNEIMPNAWLWNTMNRYKSCNEFQDYHLEYLAQAMETTGQTQGLAPIVRRKIASDMNRVRWNLEHNYWESASKLSAEVAERAATYAMRYPQDDSLAILAYDAAMLSKGLLLSAEGSLLSLVSTSDNQTVYNRYTDLLALRQRIDKADGEERKLLQKQWSQLSGLIVRDSRKFGNFTQVFNVTAGDVQGKLRKHAVAIEFTVVEQEARRYLCAIVLQSGRKRPVCVRLCVADSLGAIASPYQGVETYNMLWRPLALYLTEGADVYFAPTDVMHRIAVEYVPAIDRRLMCEHYNMYRLSNTREILRTPSSVTNTATLYGGIKYRINDDEWAAILHSSQSDEPLLAMRDIPDLDRDDRGTMRINYLPGTEAEVSDIGDALRAGGTDVRVVGGTDATESSFKSLSTAAPSILHIATHGFCKTRGDADDDRSMSQTGLLMAGAASVLYGEVDATGTDDGILTAREIAELDLTGANLVVLSACQTALGRVTSEGVFGLQRGFKKAGVQTLVMSLWPVSDAATQVLMTRFYQNLSSGMSRHKAFGEARQYLRTASGGQYSNPRYWAAFIMLDALD